uniref:Uncharacterized protein n=1 Tax=Strombidium inclinatum TaxID=197538 RepID=A0A7S3IVZ8_9SPIT|mmetsp:Transcript_4972/g.7438  ORF Transcript_4972/g.7438 Transcript_4972/m.7438 type:complete len:132 (+) Transcript_4972:538-933(+)
MVIATLALCTIVIAIVLGCHYSSELRGSFNRSEFEGEPEGLAVTLYPFFPSLVRLIFLDFIAFDTLISIIILQLKWLGRPLPVSHLLHLKQAACLLKPAGFLLELVGPVLLLTEDSIVIVHIIHGHLLEKF